MTDKSSNKYIVGGEGSQEIMVVSEIDLAANNETSL